MPITPRMGDRFLMFALLNTDLAALACSWHWDVTKTWQAFNPQLDLAFKRTMYPPDFPATFDLLWGTYGDKLPEKMARPWFALQHHAECWTPMWASPFPTSPQPSKLATWGGFLWWSISAIGTKIDTVDEIIEGPKSASRITLGIIYHHLLSLAGIWFLSLLFTSPVCAWIPGGCHDARGDGSDLDGPACTFGDDSWRSRAGCGCLTDAINPDPMFWWKLPGKFSRKKLIGRQLRAWFSMTLNHNESLKELCVWHLEHSLGSSSLPPCPFRALQLTPSNR